VADGAPDAAYPAEAARPAAPRRRALLRWTLLLLGPVAVTAAVLHFYLIGGRYVSTDNAYVRADKIAIASEVAGTVKRVAVANDQQVQAGDVLFALDDEPYRIALAAARAQLALVGNDIEALQATYRQRVDSIAKAEADLAYYRRDFERQKELAARQNTPQAKLDESQRNLAAAQQQISMMRNEAAATLAMLAGDPKAPAQNYARWRQAQAQVDKAERDLRLATVRAPRTGIVTNVDKLQQGMYLAVGQTAVSLVATDRMWIEANPKESDLGAVRPGQPATVTIDTYPGVVWRGTVDTISPATGAEFAVLPAQNSSGNWIKVVQRIPVRIRLDQVEGKPVLRAGMSANIDIDTGKRRSLADLAVTVRQAVAGGVEQPR
jgi:membrane fusion protein (multidrug efflux system)